VHCKDHLKDAAEHACSKI